MELNGRLLEYQISKFLKIPGDWQRTKCTEKGKAQLQDAGNIFIDFFFLYVVAQKHEAWWMIPDILIFLWPIPEGAKVRIEKKGKNTFGFDGFPPYTK